MMVALNKEARRSKRPVAVGFSVARRDVVSASRTGIRPPESCSTCSSTLAVVFLVSPSLLAASAIGDGIDLRGSDLALGSGSHFEIIPNFPRLGLLIITSAALRPDFPPRTVLSNVLSPSYMLASRSPPC